MSNKKSFDPLKVKSFRVTGIDLSNPVVASWTKAFVKSVIGECFHNVSILNGKLVSVTKEGLITNIENLEKKLLALKI